MQEMNYESESKAAINPMVIVGLAVVLAVIGIGTWFVFNRQAEVAPSTIETSPVASPVVTSSPVNLMIDTSPAPEATGSDETNIRTINLEAGSFYYAPTTIRVKKGERVKIVMTSKDMMHDFNVDELKVKLPITKAGETNTVEFVANETGTFEYYCSVGEHRANGQVGTLIVE